MQISSNYSSNTFTSLNNPILPELFITKLGKIRMKEAQAEDIVPVAKLIRKRQANSYKLGHFYGENAKEEKEIYKQINKNQWLKDIKEHLIKMLKKPDGNTSILVAKNDENKVIGFATMESLDGLNNKIGVIENIYLDFNYTKENLGQHLLRKITETAEGQFSDVVTQKPFIGDSDIYLREGYRYIKQEAPIIKILNEKYDESYCTWMRKNLDIKA